MTDEYLNFIRLHAPAFLMLQVWEVQCTARSRMLNASAWMNEPNPSFFSEQPYGLVRLKANNWRPVQ